MSGCLCSQISPSSVAVPTPLAAPAAGPAAAAGDAGPQRPSHPARGVRRYTPGAGLFLKSAMKNREEPSVRKGVNFATPSGHLDFQSFGPNAELSGTHGPHGANLPLPVPVRNSFRRSVVAGAGATALPDQCGGLSRSSTGRSSGSRTATGASCHVAWAHSVGTISGASALSRAYQPSEYGEEDEEAEDEATGEVEGLDWAEGPEYDTWSDADDGGATSRTVTGAATSRTVTGASAAGGGAGSTHGGGRKRLKGHVGTWSAKVLSTLRLLPDRRGRLHLPSMVVFTRRRPPLAHRTQESTWWTKIKGWAVAASAVHRLNTAVASAAAAGAASPSPDVSTRSGRGGAASGRLPPPDRETFADDTAHGGFPPPTLAAAAAGRGDCCAAAEVASIGGGSTGAASSGFRLVAARALDIGLGLGVGGVGGVGGGLFPDLDISHHTVSTVAADPSLRGGGCYTGGCGPHSSAPSVITCDDGSVHRGAILLFDASQQQRQVALAYARSARNSASGATPVTAMASDLSAGGGMGGGISVGVGGGGIGVGGDSGQRLPAPPWTPMRANGDAGGGVQATAAGGGGGGGDAAAGGSSLRAGGGDGGSERLSPRSVVGLQSSVTSARRSLDAVSGGGSRDFVRVSDVLSSPFATAAATASNSASNLNAVNAVNGMYNVHSSSFNVHNGNTANGSGSAWRRGSSVLPVVSNPDEGLLGAGAAAGAGAGAGVFSSPTSPVSPSGSGHPRAHGRLARAMTDNAAVMAAGGAPPAPPPPGLDRSWTGRNLQRPVSRALLLCGHPPGSPAAGGSHRTLAAAAAASPDPRGPAAGDAAAGAAERSGPGRPGSRGGQPLASPRLLRTPTQDLRGMPSFGDTLRVAPAPAAAPPSPSLSKATAAALSSHLAPPASSSPLHPSPSAPLPDGVVPSGAPAFATAASFPRRQSARRGSVTMGGGGGGPIAEELERSHRFPPGFVRSVAE